MLLYEKPKVQNRRAMTASTEAEPLQRGGRPGDAGKQRRRREEGRDWESEKDQDVTHTCTSSSQGVDLFCTTNR